MSLRASKRARVDSGDADSIPTEAEGFDDLGLPEVILSLHAHQRQTAAALYDAVNNKLLFFEDAEGDLTELILDQTSPQLVLVSSKADERLVEAITAQCSLIQAKVQVRPNREYQARDGKMSLLDLTVTSGVYGADVGALQQDQQLQDQLRENNDLRLSSFANLDAPVLMAAYAGLHAYLNKMMAMHATSMHGMGFHSVAGIQVIRLQHDAMLINHDAICSLQVILDNSQSENRSSGLSLYGLLNVCKSPGGKAQLRRWLLRPSNDMQTILDRHEAVECFARAENQHVCDSIRSAMTSGIANINVSLQRLKSGRATYREFQSVCLYATQVLLILDALSTLAGWKSVFVCQRLLCDFEPSVFQHLASTLNRAIDWKESKLNHSVSILPGIDEGLDNLRRREAELPRMLDKIAAHLLTLLPPDFGSLNVVYFPQIGYLVVTESSLQSDGTSMYDADQIPTEWDFQWHTTEFVYWKTPQSRELDQYLGDIHNFVADTELELVTQLAEAITEQEGALAGMHECLSELVRLFPFSICVKPMSIVQDVLIAFARVAKELQWNRPAMSEENVIRIEQGKHPLSELAIDNFIPNDVSLAGGFDPFGQSDQDNRKSDPDKSILLVMGPNGSGKSILLKTVALIVILAQIGSFGPFDHAELGLCDAIFTRVSTTESSSKPASAFLIDCNQVSFALRNATCRSLLIFDEFGKGTEANDGTGLFAGLLSHLADRGVDCPKAVLTSHFQQALSLTDNPLPLTHINLAHMSLLAFTSTHTSDLTFTFRLKPGPLTSSYAAQCAELHGVDPAVCRRAVELTKIYESGALPGADVQQLDDEELEELAQAELIARRMLETVFDPAQSVKGQLARILALA